MLLNEIFKDAPAVDIKQLSCDSRLPMIDCIFFCIKGIKYNGHEFVDEAIKNGAKVIIYSDDIDIKKKAIFIKVNNVKEILIKVSNKFYANVAQNIESYVISGCYGRSSVSCIINQLLAHYKPCASIGVFGINYNDEHLLSNQATLTILDNQKYISEIVKNNCNACTFEADVLSLSLNKLDILNPKCFIYTNTYLESPDYREIYSDYVKKLQTYLYSLENSTCGILNRDDALYDDLFKACGSYKISYGFNENSNFRIFDVKEENNKTTFKLKNNDKVYSIVTNLLGINNVYNLTSAIVALHSNGYNIDELIKYCEDLNYPYGVMEKYPNDDFNIYIDCAKSLSSYKSALQFARNITNEENKVVAIISVCSTENDYFYKKIAEYTSNTCDIIIYTEDDSRNEDVIEILSNARSYNNNMSLIIEDRKQAIYEGLQLLNKGDTFIVLGKGNEKYIYSSLERVSYEGDYFVIDEYLKREIN